MSDILVVHPVKEVAEWMVDILRRASHRPALAHDIDGAARLLAFIRFPTVLAWLPQPDLDLLQQMVKGGSTVSSLVLLSWAPADPDAGQGADRVVPLPLSSSVLLRAVDAVRQGERSPATGVSHLTRQTSDAVKSEEGGVGVAAGTMKAALSSLAAVEKAALRALSVSVDPLTPRHPCVSLVPLKPPAGDPLAP